jgi:hypothetical protein
MTISYVIIRIEKGVLMRSVSFSSELMSRASLMAPYADGEEEGDPIPFY